jgi:hypothetical protein
MSAQDIPLWWQRLGCVSSPGSQSAEETVRDYEIAELRTALASSQQALQYEQRHAAELETALAAATAPQTVEKPFAHFVQPSGFGPFVECEPKQAGSFPAYRSAQAVAAAQEDDEWRRLALQFDGHRMAALSHLRCMMQNPAGHYAAADEFLAAGPLSGEEVLAERIKALAPAQVGQEPAGMFYEDAVGLLHQVDPDIAKAYPDDPGQKPLYTRPQAAQPDTLRQVLGIVRLYPDFDGDTPFGTMIDEALAGKAPSLASAIDLLAAGRQPAAQVAVLTEADVRAAGGIIHRDGNVFFTNIEAMNRAILAAKSAPADGGGL